MGYSYYYKNFYKNELPKFENILKKNIETKLRDQFLTIEDYIIIFLDFFKNNNAYTFFRRDIIETDNMYIGFYFSEWESYIYMQRNLTCDYSFDSEFFYEETQIQFKLGLNIDWENEKINDYIKIIREKSGEFELVQKNDSLSIKNISFDECVKRIIEIENIKTYLKHYPNYMKLIINVDV